MAIADDFSVAVAGDIRYTGTTANHTVLAFLRYLGGLMDDAEGTGDDLLDITSSTAAARSTDQIATLNPPYNIDDTVAEHLFDGSVSQNNGDDLYSGYELVGSVVAGTEVMIVQDNKVLAAYYGAGINADAAKLIISRLLVKSRSGGADIDGKRVRTLARKFGDQYKEFPTTLGLASSVAAVSTEDDLNNASTDATIQGFTDIVNTEGFQELDIDGTGAAGQEFYSKWDKASRTLNDTYERTKWISQNAHIADNGTDVGTSFVVDNGTIVGQGQEFVARPQGEKLTEMRFRLKVGGGTPTGTLVAELIDSDGAATAIPQTPFTVLATSEPVLVSKLQTGFQEVIFRFNDNVTLNASQAYFAIIRNTAGTATNFVHVEGLATTGAHAGNRAEENPASTWTGFVNDDLWFTVKSSPIIHGIAGEKFRGIDTEVVWDGEVGGPFTEDEVIFWGSRITYDGDAGVFQVGEYVKFERAGAVVNGGKVLRDETAGNVLTVALETVPGGLLDNDNITGITSGATALINVTITDQDKSGGEGILLALDDNGLTGDFYYQRISGSDPVDNLLIRGRSSGSTSLVNVTVTARPIKPEYVGQSTGTNIIGAYGIGFDPLDVGPNDKFFDLANVLRTPQNNVTFTVTGLVSGEDRVLVGPRTGSLLDEAQFTLNTTLSGAAETAVVITVAIPTDTPASGDGADNTRLRVQLDNGVNKRQGYTSFAGSTFTIPATAYNVINATAPRNVFLAYIDVLANAISEAYTAVFLANRDILVRVRDGGATPIKTFETSAVFGNANSSVAAIRTSDA